MANVAMGALEDSRYRVNFIVQAINVTNHANYAGFIGTQNSQLFRQPTTVNNMRKVEFLMNFQF
jgi:hypothetical protein